MFNRLNYEVRNIIKTVVKLVYFMRGGLTYDQAMYSMSYLEREIAYEFINNRLEVELKSPHPIY